MIALSAGLVVAASILEAMMIILREKVRHDRARPPTIISKRLGSSIVRAFAWKNVGTMRLSANQWMPYIRTMRHAEYPSASSCMCTAFDDAMHQLTGVDDVREVIDGP